MFSLRFLFAADQRDVMAPLHGTRQCLSRDKSWHDSQSTSRFLRSNRYIISTTKVELNPTFCCGSSITSFLEVLYNGIDLRTQNCRLVPPHSKRCRILCAGAIMPIAHVISNGDKRYPIRALLCISREKKQSFY